MRENIAVWRYANISILGLGLDVSLTQTDDKTDISVYTFPSIHFYSSAFQFVVVNYCHYATKEGQSQS